MLEKKDNAWIKIYEVEAKQWLTDPLAFSRIHPTKSPKKGQGDEKMLLNFRISCYKQATQRAAAETTFRTNTQKKYYSYKQRLMTYIWMFSAQMPVSYSQQH